MKIAEAWLKNPSCGISKIEISVFNLMNTFIENFFWLPAANKISKINSGLQEIEMYLLTLKSNSKGPCYIHIQQYSKSFVSITDQVLPFHQLWS